MDDKQKFDRVKYDKADGRPYAEGFKEEYEKMSSEERKELDDMFASVDNLLDDADK